MVHLATKGIWELIAIILLYHYRYFTTLHIKFIMGNTCIPVHEKDYLNLETMGEFPEIKSKYSLVAKYLTKEKWDKLSFIVTKTSGFTLAKAIAVAVEFDDQYCGIYAGDENSYIDFAEVFDPIIIEYHGLPAGFRHVSNMNVEDIMRDVAFDVPVHSVRYI